jgi:hypothetical protein
MVEEDKKECGLHVQRTPLSQVPDPESDAHRAAAVVNRLLTTFAASP